MSTQPTLVLYSGGRSRRSNNLHRELVRLARQRTDEPLRFTYIPFCSDNAQTFFMRSVRRYSRFGVSEFCCLKADERPSRQEIEVALQAHIVYLAGGNTYYFLDSLRRAGMIPALRRYAERGGVLAGLSAGAHILTPHIGLAGVKGLDPDENDVRLRDLRALNLAPFEIVPHYTGSARARQVVRDYSIRTKYPVFACPDGSGVVVEGNAARPIGRGIRLFSGGIEVKV